MTMIARTSSSSSSFPIMHTAQSSVMSCTANVYEMRGATEKKSKFLKLIKKCTDKKQNKYF